ncbi:hypothetical protein SNOUR_38135 [Streptomyces noursei ATCC 11455]|nr:hypothetical protein SNOUR_38135 [Streptomyces noursei ATCC 11455]
MTARAGRAASGNPRAARWSDGRGYGRQLPRPRGQGLGYKAPGFRPGRTPCESRRKGRLCDAARRTRRRPEHQTPLLGQEAREQLTGLHQANTRGWREVHSFSVRLRQQRVSLRGCLRSVTSRVRARSCSTPAGHASASGARSPVRAVGRCGGSGRVNAAGAAASDWRPAALPRSAAAYRACAAAPCHRADRPAEQDVEGRTDRSVPARWRAFPGRRANSPRGSAPNMAYSPMAGSPKPVAAVAEPHAPRNGHPYGTAYLGRGASRVHGLRDAVSQGAMTVGAVGRGRRDAGRSMSIPRLDVRRGFHATSTGSRAVPRSLRVPGRGLIGGMVSHSLSPDFSTSGFCDRPADPKMNSTSRIRPRNANVNSLFHSRPKGRFAFLEESVASPA